MRERGGGGACGVSAPHAEGRALRGVGPARRGGRALRGCGPARRGPFVSAKGPKTMGARAWPFGGLCPGPDFLGCGTRFAQTVLASQLVSGLGRSHARRRLEVAPCDGGGAFFIRVARGMGPSSRPGGFARRSWVTILCTSTSLCIWEAGRHSGSSSGLCLF